MGILHIDIAEDDLTPQMVMLATSPPPARYGSMVGGLRKIEGTRELIAVSLVADVLQMLDGAADSAASRELKAKARSYEHALKLWRLVAPTPTRVEALLELATELRHQTVAMIQAR